MWIMIRSGTLTFSLLLISLTWIADVTAEPTADYARDIAPIFEKHCNSCHNAEDFEGSLSLESFAGLQEGGDNGPVVVHGNAEQSRLFLMIAGMGDSIMPPEEMESLDDASIKLIKSWIDAGAGGPMADAGPKVVLNVPNIEPTHDRDKPITSVAWSPVGDLVAVARFETVELRDSRRLEIKHQFKSFPGKVNSVQFSADGRKMITASGIAGLSGEAVLWDIETSQQDRVFVGHRDTIYDALLSPNGQTLATASYDQKIILWDVATGTQQHVIEGHKDAVYDLQFDPSGEMLASASGDQTIKLWNVQTGARLDTLGQPLKEQFATTVTPDGKFVIGGGFDHRIRVWKVKSTTKPMINPLMYARYAHEGGISQLAITPDGNWLISIADDNNLKVWETGSYTQVESLDLKGGVVTSIACSPSNDSYLIGKMDGSLERHHLDITSRDLFSDSMIDEAIVVAPDVGTMNEFEEREPNDSHDKAMHIAVPAKVTGVIEALHGNSSEDADLFQFDSLPGQQWMIEVNAARSKSPLDSKLEILDQHGDPVRRVLLRAVRDSYFTFRGKDSDTNDDFRLHNWEEMELNEFLYCNGEVVRLWLYPRGPDSGFQVYPGEGKRHTYFGTTATSHALHEPCYVVEPVSSEAEREVGGAPLFAINYENDDDSLRRWGTDSRLMFTAPHEGPFIVRLTDVRGFEGSDFKYSLKVRPANPDFKVTLTGVNPKISPGSGREFKVSAERLDGFEGEIEVQITGLPAGFRATNPVVIEAGQMTALGTIYADPLADAPDPANAKASVVTASAMIRGEKVTHTLQNLGEIQLDKWPAKVRIVIVPNDHPRVDSLEVFDALYTQYSESPLTLEVTPGETISATVLAHREGFDNRIDFGKQDSGRNLPHGVIVDNIGLNGLMIVEGQTERRFFLTAAKWMHDSERMFHLKANVDGNQTSLPVILKVNRTSGD